MFKIHTSRYRVFIPGLLPLTGSPPPPQWLLSVLSGPSWRPCAGQDHPEEGPEGGAPWSDDVDRNEGVNVPGQKVDGRGN